MGKIQRKIFPYLMLLPMAAIFIVYLFYPACNGFYTSFTKWDGINPAEFVGLDNYRRLLTDGTFWTSFKQTMIFTVISVPGIYVMALLLALPLTRNIHASSFFRAIFYWPCMISSIVVGLMWRFVFGEDFGIINYIITLFGGESVKWLTSPKAAMGIIIFVTIWSMAGYYMVMFVAGIKAIPEDYYEAATIDGATYWESVRFITMPLLKSTSLMILVLSTVAVIRTYPLVYALTKGGPAGATKLMVQIIQETGFEKSKMGYACAMTMVLFVVLAIVTSVQFRLNRGGEHE